MSASFIAVDWGTTRLRVHLMAANGNVLASAGADSGVQNVSPGGFPAALEACCGSWLAQNPGIPVLMAGMVGSRNGWVEAPYAATPCGIADLAAACVKLQLDGHGVRLVPGVDTRWPAGSTGGIGAYDVMRGEETQALGLGLDHGLLCLPGTHSKWIELADGKIQRFATFITGELYAAMSASFIARLAEAPELAQPAGAMGAAMAHLDGGLGRGLFQARSLVLGGDLPADGVKPFLSALLIADEIEGARKLFPGHSHVHLVAAEPQASIYAGLLAARRVKVSQTDPQAAFLAGLARVFAEQ